MTYDEILTQALNARDTAMNAGDADAWHVADRQVRCAVAAMRAEVNLGLRDDPAFVA